MFAKPKELKTVSAISIGAYIHAAKDNKLSARQIGLLQDFLKHVYKGTLDTLFTFEGDIVSFSPELAERQVSLLQHAELVKAKFLGGRYGTYIHPHYVPNDEEIKALITTLERLDELKTLATQVQFSL